MRRGVGGARRAAFGVFAVFVLLLVPLGNVMWASKLHRRSVEATAAAAVATATTLAATTSTSTSRVDPPLSSLASVLAEEAAATPANALSLALSDVVDRLNRATATLARQDRSRLAPDRVVLVVLAYDRTAYVERLLRSLALADGIQETEVVISTDGHHAGISRIAAAAGWPFAVRQIVFPGSVHLFSGMHPGTDPRDCRRDETAEGQRKSGCLGRPDRFGHFREPKYVALKLHWLWMWTWLYTHYLPPDFAGHVLAMEDDSVVCSKVFFFFDFLCSSSLISSRHSTGTPSSCGSTCRRPVPPVEEYRCRTRTMFAPIAQLWPLARTR